MAERAERGRHGRSTHHDITVIFDAIRVVDERACSLNLDGIVCLLSVAIVDRFLRARKGDLKLAHAQLRRCILWRIENKVDTILVE